MDHIWYASSRLKKSSEVKLRSQLSHTLFHLFVNKVQIVEKLLKISGEKLWMDEWMDEQMDEWIDKHMDEWMDKQMDKWMYQLMDKMMVEWMYEQMDKKMNK